MERSSGAAYLRMLKGGLCSASQIPVVRPLLTSKEVNEWISLTGGWDSEKIHGAIGQAWILLSHLMAAAVRILHVFPNTLS